MARELRRIHPAGTVKLVASRTGIPAATVKTWLAGETGMRAVHLLTLTAVYGLRIIASGYTALPDCLDDELRAARRAALERELRGL